MRVVLDSSIVVSAFRSRQGAPNAVLGLVAFRWIVPIATPALFLEYEAVLKRPGQRRVTGQSLMEVDRVLAALAAAIGPVDIRFTWLRNWRMPTTKWCWRRPSTAAPMRL